jgi:hypothetical protein
MGGNRDGCINTKDNGIEHFCMEFKGYEILWRMGNLRRWWNFKWITRTIMRMEGWEANETKSFGCSLTPYGNNKIS